LVINLEVPLLVWQQERHAAGLCEEHELSFLLLLQNK